MAKACAYTYAVSVVSSTALVNSVNQRLDATQPSQDSSHVTEQLRRVNIPDIQVLSTYTKVVQVFTPLCTEISCRAMCTGHRRQSALSHSRSTKFPSVQHDKLWPTSIFVLRSSCLELTARTSATNHFNRTFQAPSKKRFYSGRYRAQRIRDIPVQWAI